jgi:hypothetical protein
VGKVENIKYNHVPENNTIPPTFGERIKTYKRSCNGTSYIPVVRRAEYHNSKIYTWRNYRLNLEINNENRIVPFFGFGCSRYYDFGMTTIANAKKQVNVEFMKQSRFPKYSPYKVLCRKECGFKEDITLENGHVYYFEYPGGNVYFLLKADFLPTRN